MLPPPMPPPPPTPEPRHPGGQPNNTNALKHGFYARKFKPQHLDDYTRATQVTGLDEEIALLRLVILNLAGACLPAPGASPDLAACHTLEASLARLSHLLKDQRLLALGTTDPAGIIAALFADANAGLPFTRLFSTPAPTPSSLRRQTLQCEGDFQSPAPCDFPPSAEPPLPFDNPPSAEPPLLCDIPPSAEPPTPFDFPPSAEPPLPCDIPPSAEPPLLPPSPQENLRAHSRNSRITPSALPPSSSSPPRVVPRRLSRSSFFPRLSLPP